MAIETEGMQDVRGIFIQSLEHVLNNYVPESRTKLIAFVVETILRERPYMLMTEQGKEHITSVVFGQDDVRDFIFTLSFVFFSNWAPSDNPLNNVQELADTLSSAIDQTPDSFNDFGLIPEDISDRLPGNMASVLTANKWLMCILMLILFVSAGLMEDHKKKS